MSAEQPISAQGTPLVAKDVHTGAVVHGLSVTLESGLIGLVGPNGSGKTTLLRALAGVSAYRGSVQLFGMELQGLGAMDRARRVAYLPQIAPVSWPVKTRDLVGLGRLPHGQDAESEHGLNAINAAMRATSVSHLADRAVDTLSGGERARALLARALAVEAPVLIADEPIAALDPRHQVDTLVNLKAVAESGTLVIAAFHDLALASRYSDRILVMHQGAIRSDGAPDSALSDDVIADVFGLSFLKSDRFGPIWQPQTGQG